MTAPVPAHLRHLSEEVRAAVLAASRAAVSTAPQPSEAVKVELKALFRAVVTAPPTEHKDAA